MRRMIAWVLLMGLLLTGCGSTNEDLTAGYIPRAVSDKILTPETHPANFAVSLFQASVEEGKSTLVSPLSVLSALAMTANGAEGETLAQMEAVLGASPAQLNSWIHSYLSQRKEDDVLHLANAIWFNTHERFTPDHDFLQTNADYFHAGIYGAEFNAAACREINDWVEENTDGMIRDIIDEIPDGALMYLVNALAFEARWAEVYTEHQVRKGTFTTGDGKEQDAEFMYDTLYSYLEMDNATGFIRYYAGNDYAFAALLPDEGTTVTQLVQRLDGDSLAALLANPQNVVVETAIPKFEMESTLEMSAVLQAMGMTDAFDPELADLSGLGTSQAGNIFINRVLHKTFICVGEQGTRAGAATVVEANDRAMNITDTANIVYLDRPFVYMLIDTESNLPFFMGTCMELG